MFKEKGFTLAELLVSLSITLILTVTALPAFSEFIERRKANGEVHRILGLLYVARSESVKRNKVVTLCQSGNGVNCGGGWQNGWLLFVDSNRNGIREDHESPLSRGHLEQGYQLSYRAFGSSNHLRFTPLGFTLSHNGTFKLCPEDKNAKFARAVVISKTARIRVTPDSNDDGFHEDASGNPLTCP